MVAFYSKYKTVLWAIVLFMLSVDVGLLISKHALQGQIYRLVEKDEDEQKLMEKLSVEVHKMADNGFYCHLGGINEENMKSEFCKDFFKNRQNSAIFSLKLVQQLINKKCQSHDLYVGLNMFSYVLDMVSKNEKDEEFQFTNDNLRNAFLEQSEGFKLIDVKKECRWN